MKFYLRMTSNRGQRLATRPQGRRPCQLTYAVSWWSQPVLSRRLAAPTSRATLPSGQRAATPCTRALMMTSQRRRRGLQVAARRPWTRKRTRRGRYRQQKACQRRVRRRRHRRGSLRRCHSTIHGVWGGCARRPAGRHLVPRWTRPPRAPLSGRSTTARSRWPRSERAPAACRARARRRLASVRAPSGGTGAACADSRRLARGLVAAAARGAQCRPPPARDPAGPTRSAQTAASAAGARGWAWVAVVTR
jgi:hypothetical protein